MTAYAVDAQHYWYDQDEQERGRRILEAMRLYRAAEAAMRRRTRDQMHMGENDLLALRFLLRAKQEHGVVSPTELGAYLGIKTSSVTVMIDRLEDAGHVVRRPSPVDRRRIVVETTEYADAEVRKTLTDMHSRMIGATAGIEPEIAAGIVSFLDRMREAVDEIEA
ncbi:MAG TPA: MarR family transcriptional regulator [Plantibacter sp.]|uniref:MarR family winged helix-turn-helix transcriptional regulator n=2 Tax=unclassified Plantibacter TaxID=2624265 RepID=UPI002CBC5309|nr:MarR family transcriptional regulator [Plantibacter sp.]